MANKNDWQKRGLGAGVSAVSGLRANATYSAPRCLHKAQLSRWRSDHEKARYTWDYRWGRNIDCGARVASMAAKECGAIACQRRRQGRPAANPPKDVSPRSLRNRSDWIGWIRL